MTSAYLDKLNDKQRAAAVFGVGPGTLPPPLLVIALDSRRGDAERLAAARSAGQIQDSGREGDAQKLASPTGKLIDRLCAAALLQRHSSEAARATLLALAADPEPSVLVSALARLNAIDFSLALPLVEVSSETGSVSASADMLKAASRMPAVRIALMGLFFMDLFS